jgi:hypothetical protein
MYNGFSFEVSAERALCRQVTNHGIGQQLSSLSHEDGAGFLRVFGMNCLDSRPILLERFSGGCFDACLTKITL